MIRFHITKPAHEFFLFDTGPEPQIAFSFPDHFLKIGVLDGLTPPLPLAQIRNSQFLIGPFTLYACRLLAQGPQQEAPRHWLASPALVISTCKLGAPEPWLYVGTEWLYFGDGRGDRSGRWTGCPQLATSGDLRDTQPKVP